MKDNSESVEMERPSQVSSVWLYVMALKDNFQTPLDQTQKATRVERQFFQKQELMLHRIFLCIGDSFNHLFEVRAYLPPPNIYISVQV